MRVFMTGGGGFLGTALRRSLQGEVTAPGSKEADLTREGSLDRYTDKYDVIYHLAAWTQAGDFCLSIRASSG